MVWSFHKEEYSRVCWLLFVTMTKYPTRSNRREGGRRWKEEGKEEGRVYFGWWSESMQSIMHGRRDCRSTGVTLSPLQSTSREINVAIQLPFSLSPFYSIQVPSPWRGITHIWHKVSPLVKPLEMPLQTSPAVYVFWIILSPVTMKIKHQKDEVYLVFAGCINLKMLFRTSCGFISKNFKLSK